MKVEIGLDRLIEMGFAPLWGKSVGVVCNQASVNRQLRHILSILSEAQQGGLFHLAAAFGPQHGIFGTTQDNMIEWHGEGAEKLQIPVHSLYGEHREPTAEMLSGIELLLIDLPDVGSRYYTFAWTMCLVMKAAETLGIPVVVLDRPNPIGNAIEGPMIDSGFTSFVGLHPVPVRHGMTIGELASYIRDHYHPKLELKIVEMQGYDPTSYADEMEYAWVMPSPNMPTVETAAVYSGGCLIEGTNLSEGRGTTRPFEIVGAPWLDADRLANDLNRLHLDGVYFRPVQFEPTFNKYQGKLCQGLFVHVLDRDIFQPYWTYLNLIDRVIEQTGIVSSEHVKLDRFQPDSAETELRGFAWKQPPYEYVFDRMPFDILTGSERARIALEQRQTLTSLREEDEMTSQAFHNRSKPNKIY